MAPSRRDPCQAARGDRSPEGASAQSWTLSSSELATLALLPAWPRSSRKLVPPRPDARSGGGVLPWAWGTKTRSPSHHDADGAVCNNPAPCSSLSCICSCAASSACSGRPSAPGLRRSLRSRSCVTNWASSAGRSSARSTGPPTGPSSRQRVGSFPERLGAHSSFAPRPSFGGTAGSSRGSGRSPAGALDDRPSILRPGA